MRRHSSFAKTTFHLGQGMAASSLLMLLASTSAHAVGVAIENPLLTTNPTSQASTSVVAPALPESSFMIYFEQLKTDAQAQALFEEGLKLSMMNMFARAKEALLILDNARQLGHPYAQLAILFTNAVALHQNYEFSEYKETLMPYLEGEEPLGIALAAFTMIEATNYLRHYDPLDLMSGLNRAIGKKYVPAYYVKGLLLIKLGQVKEGLALIKQSAEQGFALAQYHIAFLALSGKIEMDPRQTFAMLQAALNAGHIKAYRELGYCYEKGIGTHFDYYEALRLYEQGFLHGDISASASYGLLALQLPNPDYPACFNALSFAFNNGVYDVANALGTLYLKGLGVAQNQERGFALIKEAADRGNELAIKNVIICYENGTGTLKDFAKSAEYRAMLDKLQTFDELYDQQRHLNHDKD